MVTRLSIGQTSAIKRRRPKDGTPALDSRDTPMAAGWETREREMQMQHARLDSVEVKLWCHSDGVWAMQVQHGQDRTADWELCSWEDNECDPQWRYDYYDWRGSGPIDDQVLNEITTLVSELLGYSVERICGLQPALF